MTLDVATQVLDLVRAADPGAEAEVVVHADEHALTRFANSYVHQNMAVAQTSVRLRLHTGGRTASGTATVGVDGDGLAGLVDRTLAAARLVPPDPQWPGLTGPTPIPPGVPVDEETAAADPAARAERVRAFVAAADGLETAGYCSTSHWRVTFANTAGQSGSARAARAELDGVARQGTSDGVSRLAVPRLADLDGATLGARAATKARSAVGGAQLPPGLYEVVLEPTAVVDLLWMLAMSGFNGKAVTERRSFVEPGATQFDPAVSLVDDPLGPGAIGLPFDVEGTPKRRTTFIDGGVSAGLAHDRRSAALAGTASTGHAIAGGASYGAVATNLHLLPPDATSTDATSTDATSTAANGSAEVSEVDGPAADSTVAALVSAVERGLLVTDLWYTRMLDPRTLVVTGLTRNGVWLIEDGVVTHPVQNMRFTQSYPRALGPGNVLGIGSRSWAMPSEWDLPTYRAPALRLAEWNVTGNASG